jgi:SAM-dependent methyltransferase
MRAAEAERAAVTWDRVLAGWEQSSGAAVLRAYSDAVNGALVREWLPVAPGSRILKTDLFDEAVAEGLYPLLHDRGARVTGIDISPAIVAAAGSRYPELDARCADVRGLDLADSSFDAVVSNSTLDHFDSLDEAGTALAELRRVLVPGGVLVLTLDNRANPLVAIRNALPGRLLRRLGLVAYPTGATCGPRRLRRLLADAGFAVEAHRAIMHAPRLLLRVASGAGLTALRAALGLERLESAPTRYLTAQFIAVRARRV